MGMSLGAGFPAKGDTDMSCPPSLELALAMFGEEKFAFLVRKDGDDPAIVPVILHPNFLPLVVGHHLAGLVPHGRGLVGGTALRRLGELRHPLSRLVLGDLGPLLDLVSDKRLVLGGRALQLIDPNPAIFLIYQRD